MTRFTLVHPPYRDPDSLPVAMAKAAVSLRRAGAEVVSFDANQAFWAHWLDRDFLAEKIKRMSAERRRLEAQGHIEGSDAYAYYRCRNASVGGQHLLSRLSDAKLALGTGGMKARNWAKAILKNLLDVALWPVSGVAVLNDLTLAASTERSADVLNMAHLHGDENPFFRFWSTWIDYLKGTRPDVVVLWLDEDQQLIPAATLAAILAAGAAPPRVVAAGPFGDFLASISDGAQWRGVFDALRLDDLPTVAPQPPELAAELQSIAMQRRCGIALRATVLDADPDRSDLSDLDELQANLVALQESVPGSIIHIRTPLSVPRLIGLGRKIGEVSNRLHWGAMVKFGFAFDLKQASDLQAAGCKYLHFEIKGFAGYPTSEDVALRTMVASLEAARSAGLKVLATVVYGYPRDDAESFERFIARMKPHRAIADRWVRFKIFRLYRNSTAWLEPGVHGIQARLDAPKGMDLARHVPFVSDTGLRSEEFPPAAQAMLAEFGHGETDFPQSPLLSDDAWCEPEREPGTAEAHEPGTELVPEALVQGIGSETFDTSPYRFAALDDAFRSYVPGPGRPPPALRLSAGEPERIARTVDATRLIAINAALLRVLEVCRAPIAAGELVTRLTRATGSDGVVLLRKLFDRGVLHTLASDGVDA